MLRKQQNAMIACCMFILFGFIISGVYNLQQEESANPTEITETAGKPSEVTIDSEDHQGKAYLVKVYHGKLAVFDPADENTPLEMTEIRADSLRNYDQDLLSKGITVYGNEELCMILEDFGS